MVHERAAAVSKVEKYHNLVHAQTTIVAGVGVSDIMWSTLTYALQEAVKQTQERQTQLNSLISQGEQLINAVPESEYIFGIFKFKNEDKKAQVHCNNTTVSTYGNYSQSCLGGLLHGHH